MSISISTSDYVKTKPVTIDSVDFNVRQLTASEYVAVMALAEEFKTAEKDDYSKIAEVIKKTREIYVGIFDNKKKAEKILEKLEIDAIANIYSKVFELNNTTEKQGE